MGPESSQDRNEAGLLIALAVIAVIVVAIYEAYLLRFARVWVWFWKTPSHIFVEIWG